MSRPRNVSGQPNLAGVAKVRAASCPCGRSLATGAKTFWDGAWRCEECTYKRDYPDREVAAEPKRKKSVPLQEEKLFEIAPRREDRG